MSTLALPTSGDVFTTIAIPADSTELVAKRIEKLNRKADKLGMGQFLSVSFSKPFVHVENDASGRPLRASQRVKATLIGQMPSVDGWTFQATLGHQDGGALLLRMPGSNMDIDLRKYRDSDPSICEHCNTRRKRNDTYIVANEDGETKQVGANCLKDFIGHINPLAYARLQNSVGGVLVGLGEGTPLDSTREFLVNVATMIRVNGWVASSYAQSSGRTATKYLAAANRDNYRDGLTDPVTGLAIYDAPTDADEKLADEALAWVRAMDPATLNEYMTNVYTSAIDDYMTHRNQGYLAALINTYSKEQAKAAAPVNAPKKESEYEAVVGKRSKFEFTVKMVNSWEDPYKNDGSYTYQHVLTSKDGNSLIWKTGTTKLDVGSSHTGTFRVKEHALHAKYGKQTIITLPGKDFAPVEVN